MTSRRVVALDQSLQSSRHRMTYSGTWGVGASHIIRGTRREGSSACARCGQHTGNKTGLWQLRFYKQVSSPVPWRAQSPPPAPHSSAARNSSCPVPAR